MKVDGEYEREQAANLTADLMKPIVFRLVIQLVN